MFEHDPTDPHEVGLNAERLEAIPEYFRENYTDTGKLPCMATLVSRGGEIALEDYSGTTWLGAGEHIAAAHDLPHLFDDQADHVAGRDDAVRGRQAAPRP